MQAFLLTLVLSCVPVLLFLLIAVTMELAAPRKRYSLWSRFPGGLWLIVQPGLFMLAALPITSLWKQFGVVPLIDLAPLGFWGATAAMLLIFDGLRYLVHQLEHKLFWPIHAVHHSIRELHAANSFAHPIEGLIEAFFIVIPLSMIHTPQPVIIVVGAITGFQNVVIHCPMRFHLGRLGGIFVDSRFHRVHHSLEIEHHDRNFGLLFSFWDRMFGTACEAKPEEWPDTGVEGLPPPRTFVGMLMHPLQHFQRPRAFKRTPG